MITLLTIILSVGSLYAAYKMMIEKEKERKRQNYFKNLPPDNEFLEEHF